MVTEPMPVETTADVCLIVEGCYPYVPGGVSAWIDWLIKGRPQTTFAVVALWPRPTGMVPHYRLPPNVLSLHHVYLQDFGAKPVNSAKPPADIHILAEALQRFLGQGGLTSLLDVQRALDLVRTRMPIDALYNSPVAWEIVQRMYAGVMPNSSFLHFFWAWRALLGGFLATLEFKLPQAAVYHTISTGYAGVLAARAAVETGRPALLTEHGIYTNERRIELLMADWVADTVDKGHDLDDSRLDLRDMWINAFEAYARTCYEACTEIVTLFEDNQRAQRMLGAPEKTLRVIANGIDLARFAGIGHAADDARPTIALIGRVVPIKDVKCFITAMNELRRRVPDLRALILGPVEEDPQYHAECVAQVAAMGLGDCIEFTGGVDITRYMADIHVVALTSLSESQPLVVLEAGAAGIPFVTTNVGSCREILEGRSDEVPNLGRGGIVTDLVAPDQIAAALETLLRDHDMRRSYGAALKARVTQYYTSKAAADAYTDLYARLAARPTATRRPVGVPEALGRR
jgi:polysaccharide biosynthesis protein PelF